MRVNNNIFAQNAYRNLFVTSTRLGKSLEKLSSGLRINRAADDAAGLGVSEKLRSQVSGLDVAVNNSQDGISVIQTAEGALDRTHAILRRIRDLSELAANGDKTDDDRVKYQAEVDQLIEEIDRISLTTEYNTKKLLNGALGVQVTGTSSELNANSLTVVLGAGGAVNSELIQGASVTGTIGSKGVYTIELNTTIDGTSDKVTNTQYAAARAVQDVNAGGIAAGAWEGTDVLRDVYAMDNAGGEQETLTFIQPSRDKEVSVTLDAADTINEAVKKMQDALDANGFEIDVLWNPDVDNNGVYTDGTFQFEARRRGQEFNFFVSGLNSTGAGQERIISNNVANGTPAEDDTVNAGDGIYEGNAMATNGLEALATSDLSVIVYDPNGNQTTITSHSSTFSADLINQDMYRVIDNAGYHQGVQGLEFTLDVDADVTKSWNAQQIVAGISVEGVMTFQSGPNSGDDHRISVAIDDMGSQALGISSLDVTTQEAAQTLMDSEAVDLAIAKVSDTRGNLGAMQNRLEHTIKNLGVTKENLAASESRIRDTDMAREMMEFTRNQIMQQAGTAMLAQANLANQTVLQLLG